MKTVILAGLDNTIFTMADLIDPREYKLVGYATTMSQAWNIYEADGAVKTDLDVMPIMPLDAATGYEPDCMIIAASTAEDDERVKYMIYRSDFRGEVVSLHDFFKGFSGKTAALRKLAWRLQELGVPGAAVDLGCGYGDISWQMNALMPERKLFLFDTFTGYDPRDIATEQELSLSDAKAGQYAFSPNLAGRSEQLLLERMPSPEMVTVVKGWFPESAAGLEDQEFALVHMDAGLYRPTYSGLRYFFPRMSRGGVIFVSGYENGRTESVRKAVSDLERQYGAYLITPLCDGEGTILITRP